MSCHRAGVAFLVAPRRRLSVAAGGAARRARCRRRRPGPGGPRPDAGVPDAPSQSTLAIHPASVAEGQAGAIAAVFEVTLAPAAATTVTVACATAGGSATSGVDFLPASGTLTFAPGETARTFTVAVVGDTTVEPTEAFTVTLSGATGARIGTASAAGEIRNDDASPRTSYEAQRAGLVVDRVALRAGLPSPGNFVLASCEADFDHDGDVDLLLASGDGTMAATPVDFFRNDAGAFVADQARLPATPPALVHPRKCVGGDFDGDTFADALILGHGYDQPPFAGELPHLLLGGAAGFTEAPLPDGVSGYNHGGASGDIDEDGDLDVFVTRTSGTYFLRNDGHAGFTVDTASVPESLRGGGQIYTAELIDVDADGHLDLLVSGHEHEGLRATVFWGDGTGTYDDARSTLLPTSPGWGVTIDLDAEDLDGDGRRDIVLDRTGDGTGDVAIYQGYRVQIVRQIADRTFTDVTDTAAPAATSTVDTWLVTLRLVDVDADGDLDIEVEDGARGLVWRNDGAGRFAP